MTTTRAAWGHGIATTTTDGTVLDTALASAALSAGVERVPVRGPVRATVGEWPAARSPFSTKAAIRGSSSAIRMAATASPPASAGRWTP